MELWAFETALRIKLAVDIEALKDGKGECCQAALDEAANKVRDKKLM
jgi:hypothetical protein